MQGRVLTRGRGVALWLAALALAVPAIAAASGSGAVTLRDGDGMREEVAMTLTSKQPGTPTGSSLSVEWFDPSDRENGKPYAVQSVVFQYPRGTAIDTTALPQCAASDPELILFGADACPTGSVIGQGELWTDTGAPDPFPDEAGAPDPPRYTPHTLTAFNNQDEVVVLVATRLPDMDDPSTSAVTRFVSRAAIDASDADGPTITASYPLVPGVPRQDPENPDPFLASTSFLLSGGPHVGDGGRPYMRTPSSCTTGEWTGSIVVTYQDGVSEGLSTSTPCTVPNRPPKPPPSVKPRIKISGVPTRKCTKGTFTVVVRIADAGTPRLVAVYFDGRKAGTTQQTRFKMRVHSEGLPPGVHRLKLRVIGENGRKASRTATFRRCR